LDEALLERSATHFVTVAMERLVGLVSLLIVRTSSLFTSSKNISRVKSRVLPLGKKISGVTMGNKGACCFSFLLFGTTSVSFVTSHIAAHRAKVHKRIEHYKLIVDTVNFDAAVRDKASEKATKERELAAQAEAAALGAGTDGSSSDSESGEEDGDDVGKKGKKGKKGKMRTKKKKKKKKGGGGKLEKFRAKMNLAGRKVFSATRGLGTLTHSLSAPADVRARIAVVNTAMREEAKARTALEKPPAEVPDPKNPGEFLPPLVLVEPRRVLEHDVAFFTGDLNFRLRPLLAEDGALGLEASSSGSEESSGDEDDGSGARIAALLAAKAAAAGAPEAAAVVADQAVEEEEAEPKDAKEHSSRKECKVAFGLLESRKMSELVNFDQLLGEQVSVLLCTVTFYANLAHSLTRSP
jgi:hypothetical protein